MLSIEKTMEQVQLGYALKEREGRWFFEIS